MSRFEGSGQGRKLKYYKWKRKCGAERTRIIRRAFDPRNLQQQHESRRAEDESHYESISPLNHQSAAAFPYYQALISNTCKYDYPDPASAMSLAYENRTFSSYPEGAINPIMHDPAEHDENNMQHHQRYPSPPPMGENVYSHAQLDQALELQMQDLPRKEESGMPSPDSAFVKAITKPDREVTKGEDGRFLCSWVGCSEDIRSFNRKCEWSKHMDKHDRPYKCPAEGCEKLPGFTYSGGLLRHQREVHNLHGGPRKQLNCLHPNCKRHSGKGFSRQENLNEHLRRVHTQTEGEIVNGEETEEEGIERPGNKRKRTGRGDCGPSQQDWDSMKQENLDLREELRRQGELHAAQMSEIVRQMQDMQQQLMNPRMQDSAPQALM